MINELRQILTNKRILILGFGIEGRSTFSVIRDLVSLDMISLADQNSDAISEDLRLNHTVYEGKNYLDECHKFDMIIKSPGIPESNLPANLDLSKITSQTNLFLSAFASQTIGITGTKGKSTTSSLIHHIISKYTSNTLLVGNIGKPPFDFIDKIDSKTKIVYELSAHQLADITVSPAIGVILNIFEEHLDHHKTFEKYIKAKVNIGALQRKGDHLIINKDDAILQDYFQKFDRDGLSWYADNPHVVNGCYVAANQVIVFQWDNNLQEFMIKDRIGLPGDHNQRNIMAAICACKLTGIPNQFIQEGILDFKGLEHRLEYIGVFGGIHFYNDSISTIPQATIAAVKTLGNVDTLILGGKDRGINYTGLIHFLAESKIRNLIFTGAAGKRILQGFTELKTTSHQTYFVDHFVDIEDIIRRYTQAGSVCLLSPAASSYDQFKNFEERGHLFKKIAGNLRFPAS